MKRALRGLLVATIAFFVGVCIATVFNSLMMRYLISEGIEALNEAQEIRISSDPTGLSTMNVTVCDLKGDPSKFDHATVILTGYFSRGFEDSSLYDPSCSKSHQWIWVELGGMRSINEMYCCGFTPKPYREHELEVEAIRLPLTDDAEFNKYNDRLAAGKEVRASAVGTFFSGKKEQYSKDTPAVYQGYGHMGISSLFVVEQVLSSEITKIENK
jgi:hypothetical protein